MTFDWMTISALLGTLLGGGGLGALVTLGATRRKADAEANGAVLNNMQQAFDSMKALSDERQEECARKNEIIESQNKKIDGLYDVISLWRDRHGDLAKENTNLKVEAAMNRPKHCEVPGCHNRKPRSGY